MDRPSIFLSSTVHDFADLRSALKDYLEARGCRVLASEFSDFTKPLNKHSYEACLDTIEQASLFVLLIGNRRGGWFDETNRISITRAEFQHAVKLVEAGRMGILCFVRQEVWDHRQSVKELRVALASDKTLTAAQRKSFAAHKTEFMDDPEAIIALIDAVARNHETAAAARGKGAAPLANWIHPFSTFTQIRQAIDPLITGGLNVREAAGRKALESQLLLLLQGLLSQGQSGPIFPYESVRKLVDNINLHSSIITGTVRLDGSTWSRLVFLALLASSAQADPAPFVATLTSDLLLRYDTENGTFERTAEYGLLANIVHQSHRFQRSSAEMGELIKYGRSSDASENRTVPAAVLGAHLHRLLRWADLIASTRSLARSLGGGPLVVLPPLARTPFRDQEDGVTSEEISLESVRAFVDSWPTHVEPGPPEKRGAPVRHKNNE